MNRLDRLTAILIHLQSKRVVRAQELADRFQISLRTVYRDVRSLEEAGVPIGAEAGIGYFLDGYQLPPVMFSNAEASALVFGAKLMAKMADTSLQKPFESALYKIKSVLKTGEKDHLDTLESVIGMSDYARPTPFSDQFLNQIQAATVQQQVLAITYQANYTDQPITREVEPIGLYHYSAGWHLIAFCRLRQDYRDFRTDRIRQLIDTGQLFSRQSLLSLQAYLEQLRQTEDLTEAIVRFRRKEALYAQQQRYAFGYVSEVVDDDTVTMTFLTQHPYGLGRWLISYGNSVTVEQPDSLKTMMQTFAEEISAHYLTDQIIAS